MPSLDGTVQDRHHHALPGVASPPGPSDGERRQAACGAVPAPLRGKEEGRWRQRGLGGGGESGSVCLGSRVCFRLEGAG